MGVNKEYMEKMEKDRSTRFNFLLQQTEIFSHFLNTAGKKPPKSPLKMKKQPEFSTQKTKNAKEYVTSIFSLFHFAFLHKNY